jgi:hypothetical protein
VADGGENVNWVEGYCAHNPNDICPECRAAMKRQVRPWLWTALFAFAWFTTVLARCKP